MGICVRLKTRLTAHARQIDLPHPTPLPPELRGPIPPAKSAGEFTNLEFVSSFERSPCLTSFFTSIFFERQLSKKILKLNKRSLL